MAVLTSKEFMDFYEITSLTKIVKAISWYWHCDGVDLAPCQEESLEDIVHELDFWARSPYKDDGWRVFYACLCDVLPYWLDRLDENGLSYEQFEARGKKSE